MGNPCIRFIFKRASSSKPYLNTRGSTSWRVNKESFYVINCFATSFHWYIIRGIFFFNRKKLMIEKLSSLYIHFPFCRHLCNYCDFFKSIQKSEKELDDYHSLLNSQWEKHEILMRENQISWKDLETLYIGGGTPSLWGKRGVEFLREFFISKNIKLSSQCEFTLEINPGSCKEDVLLEFKDLGVNRFSVGTQAFDEKMIKKLDRIHSLNEVYELLHYFQENNDSFQLILCLAFQARREKEILLMNSKKF